MTLEPARTAYSVASERYIALSEGGWQDHEDDTALVRRHLVGLAGPVLDLGCGPGHWTAYLQALGADVTGVTWSPSSLRMPGRPIQDPGFSSVP